MTCFESLVNLHKEKYLILRHLVPYGKHLIKQCSSILFPFTCLFCEEQTHTHIELCNFCRNHLPWIEARCYRCALRLDLHNDDELLCEKCRFTPPHFDRLYAIFSYHPPITKLITGLKFGDQLYSGRLLGELLLEQVENKWYHNEMLPEAIIPVPLHEKRLRKRGFNQAVELLGPLKKKFDIPILPHACIRQKITKAQSGLNSTQRKQNIKNAFIIPDLSELAGLDYVAVVDDVVTTGSTINALCAVLKKAGVQQIDVWCIGRA